MTFETQEHSRRGRRGLEVLATLEAQRTPDSLPALDSDLWVLPEVAERLLLVVPCLASLVARRVELAELVSTHQAQVLAQLAQLVLPDASQVVQKDLPDDSHAVKSGEIPEGQPEVEKYGLPWQGFGLGSNHHRQEHTSL